MRRQLVACLLTALLGAALCPAAEIGFKRTRLDGEFRAEGVAAGDFNGDGKLDVAAGSVYYAAPDWKMVSVWEEAKTFPVKGYSPVFCCFADDVNADGRTDLIEVDFPGKQTWWYENPGPQGGPWKKREAVAVTNNESPLFDDLTGDGRREMICGYSPDPKNTDGPAKCMIFAGPGQDPDEPWPVHEGIG